MNSLDPQKTNDGKPYGPIKYKEIVKERWLIAKNSNISYSDTGDMTPTERYYILEFISDEIKKTNEALEKRKQEIAANKRSAR